MMAQKSTTEAVLPNLSTVPKEQVPEKRAYKLLKDIGTNLNLPGDVLRFNAVFKDYTKGKKESLGIFSKAIGVAKTNVYYMMNGTQTISSRAMRGIDKMGYSSTWVNTGYGAMKPKQTERSTLTDIVELKSLINTLITKIESRDERMKGLEEELETVKKDQKDLRKMLADNKIHYKSH